MRAVIRLLDRLTRDPLPCWDGRFHCLNFGCGDDKMSNNYFSNAFLYSQMINDVGEVSELAIRHL